MDQKVAQLPVIAAGSLDDIVSKLAPDAYYQSPGGRRFLIAATLLAGVQRGARRRSTPVAASARPQSTSLRRSAAG